MKETPKTIKQKYPGSWLYSKKIIEWMFKPGLRSQLPFLLRMYSHYSWLYFKLTGRDYFIGGRRLMLFLIAINKNLFGINYRIIQLPDLKICIDLTDPRFLNVINEMLRQIPVTGILDSVLHPGDTFIDIGANHGSFSILASRIVGKNGIVIAVEPQPRMAHVIRKSLEMNAIGPYRVLETATGDSDGETEFLIPVDTSGSAGVFRTHSAMHKHKKIKVPIGRFDRLTDWKQFPGNVFLKLDIEGSEMAFLNGAAEMIRHRKPVLLMEINPKSIKASGETPEKLIGILQDLGYCYYADVESSGSKISLKELKINRHSNILLFFD